MSPPQSHSYLFPPDSALRPWLHQPASCSNATPACVNALSARALKCNWTGEYPKTETAQRTVFAGWQRCMRPRGVCLRSDCKDCSSCLAIASQVNERAGCCSLLCLHYVLSPMNVVGQSSGRTRAANALAGMSRVMHCSCACCSGRARHSRAAQAVANIAGLRVTHLQQTAVLGATLCCHFAAVRLLLRLSADATRGPLPPCCDSRHASSRQMCGACGHVLGQVAKMKLGLQHCYGIHSNGNKPAGAKTSAGAQR